MDSVDDNSTMKDKQSMSSSREKDSKPVCSVSSLILSDITGRTPDLQCRFENRWKARLLRPGGPIVKLIVDLGPYVDGSDWPI